MQADEWWDLWDEVANLGDQVLSDSIHQKPTDEKEVLLDKKRKELGEHLKNKTLLFIIIADDALLFKSRIMKYVNEMEPDFTGDKKPVEVGQGFVFHPLWKLDRRIVRFLSGKDVWTEVAAREAVQQLAMPKDVATRFRELQEVRDDLNKAQAAGKAEFDEKEDEEEELKKAATETQSAKNLQQTEIDLLSRVKKLEDEIKLIRGRQDERINREKNEIQRENNKINLLKDAARKVDINKNPEVLEKIIKQVQEVTERQEERLNREANSPDLAGKVEVLDKELDEIKEKQLERIVRESKGVQEMTDRQQNESIENNSKEIESLRKAFDEFKSEIDR